MTEKQLMKLSKKDLAEIIVDLIKTNRELVVENSENKALTKFQNDLMVKQNQVNEKILTELEETVDLLTQSTATVKRQDELLSDACILIESIKDINTRLN